MYTKFSWYDVDQWN